MPAAVRTLNEFTTLCKGSNALELRVKRIGVSGTNKMIVKLKLRTRAKLYTLTMKDAGLAINFANNIKKDNKNIKVRFFKN